MRITLDMDPQIMRRFLGNEDAASAVEFALISPAFLFVLFVWIELALSFFMQGALDAATRDASRLIRTGYVQQQGSVTAFTNKLCADAGALISCSKIQYNVQSGTSFSALNATVSTNSSGTLTNSQWSPGSAGSDVLVQVVYSRPIITPGLASFLGSNGQMTLVSSYSFQNEPYQ